MSVNCVKSKTSTCKVSQCGSKAKGATVVSRGIKSKTSKTISWVRRSRERKVEVLDPNFSNNKEECAVTVENEMCKVNVHRRIQMAAGIQPLSSKSKEIIQTSKSIPCISNSGLNEPKFQSSLSLMRNLEELKKVDINSRHLLELRLLEDDTFKQKVEKKATSSVNIQTSNSVFKQLQSLSINSEVFVSHQEWKQQSVAEKYAPKKTHKNPDLLLNHFIEPYLKQDDHMLPSSLPSFLTECRQYKIELFRHNLVCNMNHLIAYDLCS